MPPSTALELLILLDQELVQEDRANGTDLILWIKHLLSQNNSSAETWPGRDLALTVYSREPNFAHGLLTFFRVGSRQIRVFHAKAGWRSRLTHGSRFTHGPVV